MRRRREPVPYAPEVHSMKASTSPETSGVSETQSVFCVAPRRDGAGVRHTDHRRDGRQKTLCVSDTSSQTGESGHQAQDFAGAKVRGY